MKKKDVITILSILFLLVFLYVITTFQDRVPGAYLRITQNGKEIGSYPLSDDKIITLDTNTVVIKDKCAYISQATCPDHLCINQKEISLAGEEIVCLPNKLVLTITDSNTQSVAEGFYFDTYIKITIYNNSSDKLCREALEICSKYETICSRTNPESELYKLNHRLTSALDGDYDYPHYQISDELYDMIKIGLYYSEVSGDCFNIAIAPVSEQWDFKKSDPSIPDSSSISDALQYTNSSDIILNDDGTISFKSENNMIDLGGMAKGYIADKIKDHLTNNGVDSAIISLGGNILCIGDKSGTPFTIGIQKPFEPSGTYITTVTATDSSVVTSGIYERYFKKDDIIYHHIIDSKTGYPINNDIYGITVKTKKSIDGDCLSTWLFSLGTEKALEYADKNPDIEIIIIDKNNNILKK